jgi:hypothetical protein
MHPITDKATGWKDDDRDDFDEERSTTSQNDRLSTIRRDFQLFDCSSTERRKHDVRW